tara:strand:+ start:3520 stop:4542 length:1023 start_codon:yes stop_codon:yes gene_type:complete
LQWINYFEKKIMKKILLTGGLGYIGSHFVENFSNIFKFSVLDTNYFHHKYEENQLFELTRIKDIRDILQEDINNTDFIVHMGELSNDPLGDLNKELTSSINHIGTKNLLELANNTKVEKFIYMSSASVYGFSQEIMKETSKLNPLTEYSKTKVKNEEYILNNEFSFNTTILRNSTAFGFSNNLRLDLVVNDLTYGAYVNKEINLLSDGTPKRPIVHIADICRTIDMILNDERNMDKEIFNVGSDTMNFSIKEIAEIIGECLDLDLITFGKHDADQRSYELDFNKLKNYYPSFNIKFNLHKGIEDLIFNFKKYEISGNEKRISVLNKLINEKKIDTNLYWT